MRERKITRKDEWTGKLGGFDEAEGLLVSFSLSILEDDSRVVSQRLPDLTSCSSFLWTKDGTKNTQTLVRELPPRGSGSFHVGGSRVPGPNTFLIEMFVERLRRLANSLDGFSINWVHETGDC